MFSRSLAKIVGGVVFRRRTDTYRTKSRALNDRRTLGIWIVCICQRQFATLFDSPSTNSNHHSTTIPSATRSVSQDVSQTLLCASCWERRKRFGAFRPACPPRDISTILDDRRLQRFGRLLPPIFVGALDCEGPTLSYGLDVGITWKKKFRTHIRVE